MRHMSAGAEATEARGVGEPEVEVLWESVAAHDRTWVDHPSGMGFFTLDRTQGFGDLIVTSYLFNVKDTVNRFDPKDFDKNPDSAARVLSDWVSSSHTQDGGPVGAEDEDATTRVRFAREWSLTIPAGRATSVQVFRGNTPVTMVFQAR